MNVKQANWLVSLSCWVAMTKCIWELYINVCSISHLERAKCFTNGTWHAGFFSKLYALISYSRWEWDNLGNITLYYLISHLLCELRLVSATFLFNFLSDTKFLFSVPLWTVAIPQLPCTLATLCVTHLNHTTWSVCPHGSYTSLRRTTSMILQLIF